MSKTKVEGAERDSGYGPTELMPCIQCVFSLNVYTFNVGSGALQREKKKKKSQVPLYSSSYLPLFIQYLFYACHGLTLPGN